jgi:bacterioferritin-associated ferredoxin
MLNRQKDHEEKPMATQLAFEEIYAGEKHQERENPGATTSEFQVAHSRVTHQDNDAQPTPVQVPPNSTTGNDMFDCLPVAVKAYIEAAAVSTNVPPEMIALMAISLLGSLTQSRYQIEAKADWIMPLNHYLLVISTNSSKLRHVLNLLAKPIYEYQFNRQQEQKKEIVSIKAQQAILDSEIKRLIPKAASDNSDQNKYRDELVQKILERDSLHIPLKYQLITEDASADELKKLIGSQGNCVTCLGTGRVILAQDNRNAKSNQELLLSAYSGHSLSRQNPTNCFSLILVSQPDILDVIATPNARLQELLSCFSILIDLTVGDRRINSAPVPRETSNNYYKYIIKILQSEDTGILKLSKYAKNELSAYVNYLDGMLSDNEIKMDGWISKMMERLLRIAGALHVIIHPLEASAIMISAETIQHAILLCDYLFEQASLAYKVSGHTQFATDLEFVLDVLQNISDDVISQRNLNELTKSSLKNIKRLKVVLDKLELNEVVERKTINTRGGESVEVTIKRDALQAYLLNHDRNDRKV